MVTPANPWRLHEPSTKHETPSPDDVSSNLERETGIEPATNSLEGCDSTTELLPLTYPLLLSADDETPSRQRPIHLWWRGEDSNLRSH